MSPVRLLILLTLTAMPCTAFADTYYVDVNAAGGGDGSQLAPFQTVQAAIDVASTGDTVEIAAGTYTESGISCNVGITLRGSDGADATFFEAYLLILTASSFSEQLTIEGLTFRYGRAMSSLPLLSFSNCPVELRDCKLMNNDIDPTDTLLRFNNCDLTLDGIEVRDNEGSGRLIQVYSGTLTASNCRFDNNEQTALALSGCTSVEIRQCEFLGVNGGAWGGGILMSGVPSFLIESSVFSNNSYYASAGIDLLECIGQIDSSLFAGNTELAGYGSAIYLRTDSSLTLRHCTFADNVAATGGAAVTGQADTTLDVQNSVFWGNTPAQIDTAGTLTVTYSDIQGGQAGTGNIGSDPLFIDSANGDYRLGTGSPCIDAGTTISDPPETDLEGDPRNVDGDSDSTATPDMGCDELDLLVAMIGTRETGQTVHFDAMAPPAFEDHFVQIFFSLTNGSVSGGLTVPNSGGQKLMLDVDAVFNEMLALSAYFRVQLGASGSGSTSDVVIPAGAPTGVSLYFAGLSWDPGSPGAFDFTPTQEIVLQ